MGAVRRTLGLVAIVATLLAPAAARAQKPTSESTGYSAYEKETIKRALASTGGEIDPAPEGKTIERIDTMRLEVLEDRDPVPEEVLGLKTRKLANSLHYVTRDFVIRREMLLGVGDKWEQVTIDEIARNMRARMPLQVSIVIIVPLKGSAPDKVAALVITKDIWSLRLSFNAAVTPGGLEDFLLVPQETNLLGLQHTVSTRFEYQPEAYTIGAGYKVPRFGRSWIGASTGATMTINRRSLEPEGSSMSLATGQGLYSTRTEWAWAGDVGYAVGVARRYVNARVAAYDSPRTQCLADGTGCERIPNEYRSRAISSSVGVTRSFGWGLKNNFSLTFNATSASYDTFDLPTNISPVAQADYIARFIPVGETRIYPALSWATFRNDYLRTLDISTLALQEDYRLGHDISVSVYPVMRALGSTRDLVGASARAGYAIALGDGLVGASVSTFAESVDGVAGFFKKAPSDSFSDASFGASFGAVSPRTGIGRVVMNTSFNNRYRNYLNARTFTGGDDRLRGYPSNYFFGKDTMFYNLEFRSTSIDILKLQWGGVAFYDVGDASNRSTGPFDFNLLRVKHSVGAGLRVLFPQVNRLVFRLDFAFPLNRGPFPETGINKPVDPFGFYFTFDQAFTP
jgi:hypothetical protein